MTAALRIALVHAMPVAIEPVAHVFREMWPQARVTHLLDDALPATFEPSIPSLKKEFEDLASSRGIKLKLRTRTIPAAIAALQQGRNSEHDRLIAAAAVEVGPCDALVLGQFSMARAAAGIPAAPGRKVLTSPHSAVARLKQIFGVR